MNNDDELLINNNEIKIQSLYPYQVAGHGALFKLSGGKICKPLIEIECKFYQSIMNYPELIPFIPKYYGICKINFTKKKIKEWVEEIDGIEKRNKKIEINQEKINKDNENVLLLNNLSSSINPWSLKVGKENLNELLKQNIIILSILYSFFFF